ncbi:TolC family protein [Chitinophaga polysaccharea]|uniref:TolC family protein n=1 Tax=Chitinophaga TaxID=79328 RepID=UPI0014559EF3|nr:MULTISPECIES: TolC family protein [Chitinophaga]NLR57601.1 TolC family protein [Chitinophaga polysaccharea]NLU95514.1 TolC family protein [Chitinophaga sp. Ak27]
MLKKYMILAWGLLLLSTAALAQLDTSFHSMPVSLPAYLGQVGRQHLGYAAEKYNVSIASAAVESAKVFPDPQLSVEGFDNQHRKLGLSYGYNVGLGTTLELGRKRNARIELARGSLEQRRALLEDYFRNLRADAAAAYFNALQQQQLLQVQQSSYAVMRQLADADAIRFQKGVITEMDARQSKLEADHLLNSVCQQQTDWKTALVQLSANTGALRADTLLLPAADTLTLDRSFVLMDLITQAQTSRADAVAANVARAVADKNLALVKANRKIDLGVNVGLGYNAQATSEIAPTPRYMATTAGVSIPLKIANHYRGDLKAAQYTVKQAAVTYHQVLLQIQAEVTQAWYNYHAAAQQLLQFHEGLLNNAQRILDGKIYSYRRGETSLLEVLNAQRTWNELQQDFCGAQYHYATTLVELERAAGIWDIE